MSSFWELSSYLRDNLHRLASWSFSWAVSIVSWARCFWCCACSYPSPTQATAWAHWGQIPLLAHCRSTSEQGVPFSTGHGSASPSLAWKSLGIVSADYWILSVFYFQSFAVCLDFYLNLLVQLSQGYSEVFLQLFCLLSFDWNLWSFACRYQSNWFPSVTVSVAKPKCIARPWPCASRSVPQMQARRGRAFPLICP